MSNSGIKYISALDKNQIEGMSGFDFSHFAQFDESKTEKLLENVFIKLDEQTYCKEVSAKQDRRFVLCFNPQTKNNKKLENAINEYNEFERAENQELLKITGAPRVRKKIDKFLKKSNFHGFAKAILEEKRVSVYTKKITKTVLNCQENNLLKLVENTVQDDNMS